MHTLHSISPLDGRYFDKINRISAYFSEFALIKGRVLVEIEYFKALSALNLPFLPTISQEKIILLDKIHQNFGENDALRIKEIEKITNHDVKAVEYFLREKFAEIGLQQYQECIHFGLTSQDINNTAIPFLLKNAIFEVFLPKLKQIIGILNMLAIQWKDIPMLARTHGQPASPTILGKEIKVFVERLQIQIQTLENIPNSAKFGGATGNFNAHYLAFPAVDWEHFAQNLLQNLGLKRSYPTTQIEHYDNLASQLDAFKRINVILVDFARDMWQYIAMDYFKQKIQKNEVGSSAMPHKVNPIDFENAEGNLLFANSIFTFLAEKLPISRLQRDLTDSTVLRNLGVPFGHSFVAYLSLEKGISKLQLNENTLRNDLDNNWAVVAEAIQTILRRENYPDPYNALKELTRTGEKINAEMIKVFVENLHIDTNIKNEILAVTPFNYIGKFVL